MSLNKFTDETKKSWMKINCETIVSNTITTNNITTENLTVPDTISVENITTTNLTIKAINNDYINFRPATKGTLNQVLASDNIGGVFWKNDGIGTTPNLQEVYDTSTPAIINLSSAKDINFIDTLLENALTITENDGITTKKIVSVDIIKLGGTATQFLKADGSIDSNTYLTNASTTIIDLITKTQNIDLSTNAGNTYINGNIITYQPDISNIGGNNFRFNGFFNDMNYKGLSTYLPNSRTIGNILPFTTLTDTIGTSLLKYNEIYTGTTNTNSLIVNSSMTCPLILGNTTISGNITPTNDNSSILGTALKKFNNIFTNTITADILKKTNGTASQFLKADGTTDENIETRNFEIVPIGARDKWFSYPTVGIASASLAYFGGNLILSYNTTFRIAYSLDYAVNWILCTIVGGPLAGATNKPMLNTNTNEYLTIEYGNKKIYTSPDGITFTHIGNLQPSAMSGDAIYWNNLYIVATSVVGQYITTSTDGITWTLRAATRSIYNFCAGFDENGANILLTHGQSGGPMYSYDGIIWNNCTGPAISGRGICYSNDKKQFIILDIGNSNVQKSTNGRDFTYFSNIGTYGNTNLILYVENDSYGKKINMYYIPATDVNLNFGMVYSPNMADGSIRTNLLEGATVGNSGIYGLIFITHNNMNRFVMDNNVAPYIKYTNSNAMAFTNGISFIPYPKIADGKNYELLCANGTVQNIKHSGINMLSADTLLKLNNLSIRWNAGQPQWKKEISDFDYAFSITYFKPGVVSPLFLAGSRIAPSNVWQYFTTTGAIDATYNAALNGGRYEITLVNNLIDTMSYRACFYYSSFNTWGKVEINGIN